MVRYLASLLWLANKLLALFDEVWKPCFFEEMFVIFSYIFSFCRDIYLENRSM